MLATIHGVPAMHDDHRNWQAEHSMWQQDSEYQEQTARAWV